MSRFTGTGEGLAVMCEKHLPTECERQNAEADGIVRSLAEREGKLLSLQPERLFRCVLCGEYSTPAQMADKLCPDVGHKPDCTWLRARQYVAEHPEGENVSTAKPAVTTETAPNTSTISRPTEHPKVPS